MVVMESNTMNVFKMVDDRPKNNQNKISPRIRFKVLNRDGYKCKYCGQNSDNTVLEIDHIIPRSKGGTDSIDNLITSCRMCNLGKSDELILEYTTFDKLISDLLLSIIHSNEMFMFTVKDIIKNKYNSDIRTFSKHCCIPESTLYKILSGTRTVNIQTLRKIIDGFEQLELKEVDDD